MDDGLGSKMVGLGMAWALSQGGAVLELCWNCVGTVLEKKNKLPPISRGTVLSNYDVFV